MGRIPEGWLPYSPIGNQVPGTRFIAFKVPLREAFVDKLQAEDRFTIPVLLNKVPDLGLVIDLTHTTKYYNKRDFLDKGVDYVKISTLGQNVPPQELVERFFEVVDYYLDAHKNDNSLIGVHCTHGVNRTGYMLCRYLIQRLGYSFNEAVEAVGRSRGHMIERSHYIESLQVNTEALKKKSTDMRGIEESKTKIIKKEIIPMKKEEVSRRGAGKDGLRGDRGDYRSPIRVVSPGRPAHRMRSRTPPLQQAGRGRSPPMQVRGRSPTMMAVRGRSPPRYDRPSTAQRERTQPTAIRERMTRGRSPSPHPPLLRGRMSSPVRGRSPQHSFRGRTPPGTVQMSHRSPQGHIRVRSPSSLMRGRSPQMIRGRSPPRHQGRGRSPPSEIMRMPHHVSGGRTQPQLLRGRSPPPPPHLRTSPPLVRVRSRSPHYRSGHSPPPHSRGRSPLRGRSPPRPIRGRTPPNHYARGSSPGHIHIPRDTTPPLSAHGHPSRRDQMIPNRGRSPPPGRVRSHSRGRSPASMMPYRGHIEQSRRNNPPIDHHSGVRVGYEDRRTADTPREYNERFPASNQYSNDRGFGTSGDYYPDRYEKPRRERSSSPRGHHPYYPNQREEITLRPEYSPPRDSKRRRKSPPAELREKVRRSSPPSGYNSSRESLKKDKREYSSTQWDHVQDKEGPDCREILNEKRSLRDAYPDPRRATYPEVQKFPPPNADLRDALEEEKRRRHGNSESGTYRDEELVLESRIHEDYPSRGYQNIEGERGGRRRDYGAGPSVYDASIVRPDNQRHHGFPKSKSYVEPVNHKPDDNFVKPREDDVRKSRVRRGNKRVFDRLSRGGGRGRGGGHNHWP